MVKTTKQMRPGRGSDQFIVRLPSGMRADIGQEAQRSGRSMNAEIVARLEASFQSFLSQEGLIAVSKRLESAAVAFEDLFIDIRNERLGNSSGQNASAATWKGFLRLALVTCPVALIPATAAEMPSHVGISGEVLDGSAPGSSHTIDIDEFVPRAEIDPRYVIRPYYLRPDGKVGHDAFAVIRETIRETNKIAIGRIVLTNREHIIALDPFDKGLVGTLLRYPHEVRSAQEYFDEIQDVKITRDMLDLAKHIVEQKSGHFDPEKFSKAPKSVPTPPFQDQSHSPITSGGNIINLMDALKKSLAKDNAAERRAATRK